MPARPLTVGALLLWAGGLALALAGTPTALAAAAAVLLTVARLSRRMSWAAATACAVLLLLAAQGTLLAVCATLSSGPLPWGAALAVQAAPALLACLPVPGRLRGGGPGDVLPGRAGGRRPAVVAAVAAGPVAFVAAVVGSRLGARHGPVAWAMGDWDARNHVVLARQVLARGGLDLELLGHYPLLINAITAVVADVPGRTSRQAGALLANDVAAQAWVWGLGIVLGCVLGGLTAGRLTADLPGRTRTLAMALGSLTPLGGLVLGAALSAGFLTATWGVVLLQGLFAGALEWWRDHPARVALIAAGTALAAVVVWTVLALPALLLGAWAGAVHLRRAGLGPQGRRPLLMPAAVAAAAMALLAYLQQSYWSAPMAATTFIQVVPVPVAVSVLTLAGLAAGRAAPAVRSGAVAGVLALVLGAVLGVAAFLVGGVGVDGYYPRKLIWIIVGAALPTACAAGFRLLPRFPIVAAAGTLALVTLFSAPFASPVLPWWSPTPGSWPERQVSVFGGPSQPSAAVVDAVLEVPADGTFVLYVEARGAYQDRDANLWLSTLRADGGAEPLSPGGGSVWDVASVCGLLAVHPQYRVVTGSAAVAAALHSCAPSTVIARVEPGAANAVR